MKDHHDPPYHGFEMHDNVQKHLIIFHAKDLSPFLDSVALLVACLVQLAYQPDLVIIYSVYKTFGTGYGSLD